ncbi:MAG TPA: site-2 protease family protein [Bdellovibrionales bacterium]|nr:site-2 protease family protein [Bdellovibrionales bacterium]
MFVIFLFSLCFHEFAHAFVAHMRGDNTAQMMGRLTLNPMAHADPLGTVILPLIGMTGMAAGLPIFGWARPVPVDERNLKRPRQDMFWIASAGPLSNILLATLGVFGYTGYLAYTGLTGAEIANVNNWSVFAISFVATNLALAFFNLIPFHPLDGGKVIARFLPESMNRKLEENEQTISIVLIMVLFLGGFAILRYPIFWTFQGLVDVATSLVG